MWKGLKRKCVVCKPAQVQDDSSSEEDSDEVILDDSNAKLTVKVMKVTFTMKVHWIDVLNVGRSSSEQTNVM